MADPETAAETRPFARYAEEAEAGDVLVYQFATASAIAPWLGARPETLVVNYHNVTPPEYYAPWDNGMARHQLLAQTQLRALAPAPRSASPCRPSTRRSSARPGFAPHRGRAARRHRCRRPAAAAARAGRCRSRRRRAPAPGGSVSGASLRTRGSSSRSWRSWSTRARHDPEATLEVVGRPVVPSYTAALHRFVDELGLRDAVRFTGALSDDELVAAMGGADVLVVTSRHEGFGVPVLEAMALGLPVVANDAGALPEVVGDAGLLVEAGDPYALAAAVARVLGDGDLRAALGRGGGRRIAALDLPTAAARAVDLVTALGA